MLLLAHLLIKIFYSVAETSMLGNSLLPGLMIIDIHERSFLAMVIIIVM